MSNNEKSKVEEAIIDMMDNNKFTTTKLTKKIPSDLYNRLDRRWKQASKVEKQIREDTLAKITPELTNKQNTTFLEKHRNRFVPKFRTFMILHVKIEVVVQ